MLTALPVSRPAKTFPALSELPGLPSALRYWDDYLETYHIIRDLSASNMWKIRNDGQEVSLRFDFIPPAYQTIAKHIFVELFSRVDTTSVLYYAGRFKAILEKYGAEFLFELLIGLPVHEARDRWITEIKPKTAYHEANAIKSLLHSLCTLNIGPWSPSLHDYVAKLPTSRQDPYRVVRTGDCFVPLDTQSLIIDYFDEMTTLLVNARETIDTADLRDLCVLIVSHQHGLRPGQIARIKRVDVRLHNTGAVHFSYPLIKRRGGERLRRVSRRVKREWCPLFVEYHRRQPQVLDKAGIAPDALFALTPDGVTRSIKELTERLTGEAWTPTELRHTAAQRLADAGNAHMALSEFMGHASSRSALVYFDASPTQADRINKALALSPIYTNVVEVARTRTIEKAALLQIPPEKQIGGAPHGIPISGIGGCAIGQPLCAKNPILSCYTCRKFLPARDADIHEEVLESLRPVVAEFATAARGNEESPAYTQLRRMLTAVQQVVGDIRAGRDEPADWPGKL